MGGLCNGFCGKSSNIMDNLFAVSSHELIETVTDPAVGLATTISFPLGWYDLISGEVGDACNALQGAVLGNDGLPYTVQKIWSQTLKSCAITKASSTLNNSPAPIVTAYETVFVNC